MDLLISLVVILGAVTIISLLIIGYSKLEDIAYSKSPPFVDYGKILKDRGYKVVSKVNLYNPKEVPCIVITDTNIKVYKIEDDILVVRYLPKELDSVDRVILILES